MESISPKLVQSWQSPRALGRTWSECLEQWQAQVPSVGASAVLVCACLAEAFNPSTAGLAVAAASWGFLTLAHWSRHSAPPAWRSLLVLAPFVLLMALILSGVASASTSYDDVKRVGELSGLAALGTALHLTIRRRSVLRRVLVITCGIAIACVGLVSVSCIVAIDPSQTLIERFRSKPDLLALSLLALCLAIGLVGQRKDQQWSRRIWLVFGCLPLVLPLVLSISGLALACGVIALAVSRFFLMPRSAWRHTRWLAPSVLAVMLVVSISRANPGTWQAIWEHPLLGSGVRSDAVAATQGGWMIALVEFGIGGLLLLGATALLYLRSTSPSSKLKPQALRDWCWIGCAMMAVMAVWASPFDHHGVPVLTVILFVGSQWHHRTTSPRHETTGMAAPPLDIQDATHVLPAPVIRKVIDAPKAFAELSQDRQRNHRPQIWRQRHTRLRA